MFFKFEPAITDIEFSKTNWTLHEENSTNISWYNEFHDPVRLQLFVTKPTWPFDLQNGSAAKQFFEQQSKEFSGAMIEMRVEKIQTLDVLVGIFKYRAPIPNSLAIYYVGIIWIPFKDFTYQINFESLEKGTTGIREALVMAQDGVPDDMFEQAPISIESMDEFFKLSRQNELKVIPSDDKKWDELLPDHPLTKVRNAIVEFFQNVKINPRLFKQKIYRYPV
jgi:hypothetical protein